MTNLADGHLEPGDNRRMMLAKLSRDVFACVQGREENINGA